MIFNLHQSCLYTVLKTFDFTEHISDLNKPLVKVARWLFWVTFDVFGVRFVISKNRYMSKHNQLCFSISLILTVSFKRNIKIVKVFYSYFRRVIFELAFLSIFATIFITLYFAPSELFSDSETHFVQVCVT